jgi:hypothetical protein
MANSRQGVILQLGGWVRSLTTPHRKKEPSCYKMLHGAGDFGTLNAVFLRRFNDALAIYDLQNIS